jgi:tRNA-Thr(GGU) m(6)t(6)A37 methyltransferase TsaA
MKSIKIKPIGIVHNNVDLDNKPDNWFDVVSEIRVYSKYKKGLYRLSKFKRIIVIFHFHKTNYTHYRLHPRGNPENPIRGVFATRSPHRPNKLGMTEVELVSVRGNIIKVRGLDALDGTPVIDIKNGDK